MESKVGAGSLQQPNVSSSVQQPSRGTNVLQGSLQQPTQQGSLQQPSQLGPLQQSSQLGSLQQPTQLGPYQQSSQLGSLQQPSQLGPHQQSSQLGSLQQPSSQLGSYQQPSQLGSQQQPTQLGSYQQSSQLGPLQQPTQYLGSYQQPGLSSNVLQGSLQQPNQLGPLQPAHQLASKMSPSSTQQLIRSDRGSMLTVSDDNWMVKQIQATHAPDGREIDIKSLLYLVEDILNRATLNPDGLTKDTQAQIESLEERTHQAGFLAMLDALSYTIDRISCELSYKALGGTDAHQTTLSIFSNLLSYYAWDAKLVLTLAAFALHYGEFWLLAQIYSTNQLAKSMALLKQVPGIIEHAGALKPRFDALNDLIRAVLEVTRCVVQFTELPSIYITPEVPALSTALGVIPTAVYWAIRSIVACATQITSFTSMGYEFVTATEAHWELSTLAHKLKNMRDHLKQQLEICYQFIEGKRDDESFQTLVKLFEMIHIDNMRVLRALIYPRDDLQPLVDGSTQKRVNIDVLRRKNVLLLISSLDISQEELSILEQIYNESRQHSTRLDNPFEIVWIPVVGHSIQWTDSKQKQFDSLQSTMPWYTVHHPSLIGKPVVKFIKEKWHFRNKPILVVLDPQGKVVSPNAIHMMWIWGSNAFPFTSFKEEMLWRDETWKLELLVDGIDQLVLNWIKDEKFIFLYGGDDTEWVRKFANTARAVAAAARIPLEMVYVGKGSKREQIRQVIATITVEKLGYCWQDQAMIWFFWTRLESMLFSKIQLGKANDHTDPVMHGIKRLLSYDKESGWAVLSKGSSIVVNGHGTTVLTTLLEYETWKANVALQGFDLAFKNHHDMLHGNTHPCCRFEFSHIAGRIPEGMRCPECHHDMNKYTTFLCCHDDGARRLDSYYDD